MPRTSGLSLNVGSHNGTIPFGVPSSPEKRPAKMKPHVALPGFSNFAYHLAVAHFIKSYVGCSGPLHGSESLVPSQWCCLSQTSVLPFFLFHAGAGSAF